MVRTSGRQRREHLAWELLVALGPFAGEPLTMRAAWSAKGNSRQHTVETLVDRYGLPPGGVRDLLVDYLRELKPSMDYGTLEGWAYRLVRLFWWEILQINPDQADLHVSAAVAAEWRERLAVTTDGQPRREIHSILFAVRGMYRDLAEWSHDEPVRWGRWVAPCPVSRHESKNASKAKRRQQSRMQNRTRALTALLPALVTKPSDDATGRHGCWPRRSRQATGNGSPSTVLSSNCISRRRVTTSGTAQASYAPGSSAQRQICRSFASTGGLVDITAAESDGFWAWAVIETLRHTGIRIEELLEHRAQQERPRAADSDDAGTGDGAGRGPAPGERHQRPDPVVGALRPDREATRRPVSPSVRAPGRARNEVLSPSVARRLLLDVAASAGLRDAGEPIHFTPHDFRRLFTTEMVSSGLPLHITATLLGHLNLDTTRGYTAVFPEEVIAAHQHFIERRRATRPGAELRTATGEEWAEFENHFLLRKVALGDCHRPYGTPCVHEHACVKCRFLRVDPAQLPRIEEMTANAIERLAEAQERVWLGEVAALEDSLKHLRQRHAEAEQQLGRTTAFERPV